MFRDVTNHAAVFSAAELFDALHLVLPSGQSLTEKIEGPHSSGSAREGQMPLNDFGAYTADRTNPDSLKLDVVLRHQGKIYKSHVHAERLWPGAFEIRALTLDNAPLKLDSTYDLREALASIGHNHIRAINCKTLPEPSKQKKDLGDLAGEFLARALARLYTPKPNRRPAFGYVRRSNLTAENP